MRRATNKNLFLKRSKTIFLSTLSLRRATLRVLPFSAVGRYFYPRSPCGERPPKIFRHCTTYLFLSTLSLRRATVANTEATKSVQISIHALLAESDLFEYIQAGTGILFLSTLSLRRATALIRYLINTYHHFYPRSPCGERQHAYQLVLWVLRISIHALLAESDAPNRRPYH